MKHRFKETVSLLIGTILVSIGILWIVACLTLPAQAEDTPTEKQENPAIQVSDQEIIVGYAKEVRRFNNEDHSVIKNLIEDANLYWEKSGKCTKIKKIIKDLCKAYDIFTTLLIGDAQIHRCLLSRGYVGFLTADKIIFIDNKANGDRLLTIAMGNVKFLRGSVYITGDYAHQVHKEELITFKKGVKIADKNDVKITGVQTSIEKFQDNHRDATITIKDDLDKLYPQIRYLWSALSKQIAEDTDKEDQNTVWTSVFVYDLKTDNEIAEGGVKFKIFIRKTRAD